MTTTMRVIASLGIGWLLWFLLGGGSAEPWSFVAGVIAVASVWALTSSRGPLGRHTNG